MRARSAEAVLPLRALLLERAADRPEVAPGAGASARRRRQDARLDRAVDDLQHLDAGRARSSRSDTRVLAEAAGGGAK